MPLSNFHPAVSRWFSQAFPEPTPAQRHAWPAIQRGRHALIAAPTGSGKTLAAFLAAIDDLVRRGLEGTLTDETQVVYVSPLKALSNDVHRNLELPLAGIGNELAREGLPLIDVRALVRTGDTTPSERVAMPKKPPHILVTTPESLYLLLTSESGRAMLGTTRTVIVDEIHALAATKRGSHLALSLERLAALTRQPFVRIGLSATQKPIEEIARFLTGTESDCTIVDTGHVRERDLALELPGAPLEAVMSNEVWELVYARLAQLISDHRTTLVFVNTRRLAERVTRHLSERLGRDRVASHHGSLSKETRLDAERRLKQGKLRALVATASLELGIDIGDVDLVCQLGSTHSIATFLQRVGRANHAVTGVPEGRLFPLTRDDLVECAALLDSVQRGELDRLRIRDKPLDVLAQQIVAEVSAREWREDELYALVRRASPYRALGRREFDDVVRMLSEGMATRRGRQSAYLHRDVVNGRLRARKGARLTAITNGGAIPDNADYPVILEPSGTFIGTVNEDFAFESMSGDIFQLGNAAYRVLRIESGRMRVEDAQGHLPNVPFWLGEAPARSDQLSFAVSRLRTDISRRLGDLSQSEIAQTTLWACDSLRLGEAAASQLVDYLGAAQGILGALPTQQAIFLERFFDESGGTQLVLHAPFGSRINRAWGLALRKRFCRKFNFELQAAATEDALVLSLGETHSFPLDEVARYLNSRNVRDVLVQALLTAPLFTARWRWTANIALAVKRARGGRKRPANLQRMDAEDLIAVLFPDQVACAENLAGEREVPDHPLVNQTIDDCLHDAMDVDGLVRLLQAIEHGETRVITRDLPHPSPLAQEVLNAKPYAFLDDAPLEERRTRAVMSRRWLDPATAADMGRLDPAAIARVREEAWPIADNADELHDALMQLVALNESEGEPHGWQKFLAALQAERRADVIHVGMKRLWVAAEHLALLQVIYPNARSDLTLSALPGEGPWSRDSAIIELLRGRLQGLGPVSATELAGTLDLGIEEIQHALVALESEGFAMRGQWEGSGMQWCERRLLARIHRYTIKTLRAEIEPVAASDFLRFLFSWHGTTADPRPEGPHALAAVIEQLEGFEAPASAWETEILPARLQDYDPAALDALCLSGRVTWSRLTPPKNTATRARATAVRTTPIALLTRKHLSIWHALVDGDLTPTTFSHEAAAVAEHLRTHGASFFDEIVTGSHLLKSQVEDALGELIASGFANADSFSGLRALIVPPERRRRLQRRRRASGFGIEEAGRWSWLQHAATADADRAAHVEQIARILLGRYGVVFRRLLERENDWLPAWYELLRAYRRLEARGEIRGGRFVAGFAGEQYALPEAVGALREIRRRPGEGRLVAVCGADPLNLVGIITPGARVPALTGNRVLYRDGSPIAVFAGGEAQFLAPVDAAAEWTARNALLRAPYLPARALRHH